MKSNPDLTIPYRPLTTGTTGAVMFSMFQGRPGTPAKSSRTSLGGLKKYDVSHLKVLGHMLV